MWSAVWAGVWLMVVGCASITHQRHHRRSISYDPRWFGFRFAREPESGIYDDSSVFLHCSHELVRSRETSVEWKKDGIPLILSKRVQQLGNGTLCIGDATPSDAGVYQCSVTVNSPDGSTWTFLSKKAKVGLVSQSMKWLDEPSDQNTPKGKPAAFRCRVEAVGTDVRWFKDEQLLQSHVVLPSHTLEIPSVADHHSGQYRCDVTRNGHTVSSRTARLTVLPASEVTEVHTVLSPQSQKVHSGESVVLECLAYGQSNLEVIWTKNSEQLHPGGNVHKVGASSLLIEKVSGDDAGSYSCRVSDSTDAVEKSAFLSVIVNPHITTRPEDKVAAEKSDVELECFSSGRPLPSISWFKNGEALIASEYFVIDANRLRILGVVKTDQGVYECMAENEGGSTQAAVQLLVDGISDSSAVAASSGEPLLASAPLDVRVKSVGSRDAVISWDAPVQKNGRIINYHVYYRDEGSDRERFANSSSTSRTLNDLHPNTVYKLRVVAENEAGMGNSSKTIYLQTVKEQSVPNAVSNLQAVALGSETIQVTWKPPQNGPTPRGYKLFYLRIGGKDNEKETMIVVSQTAYTLHGMDKYTEYLIRVEAEGENGPGLSSDVHVRTLSDVPSGPPPDIAVAPLSSTSIRTTWKTPDTVTSNGPITAYRLKYKNKARGSKAHTLEVAAPATSYTIEDLEPGTSYTVRMAILNQNGTGPFSDWLTVDTPLEDKEETVLGAPRELTQTAGQDYILIQWLPPSDSRVVIRGYQIGWGQNVPDVLTEKVDAHTLHYRITGVKPDRDYVVSVRAFNRQGSGFPIYETVRTTHASAMDSGVFEGDSDGMDSPLEVRAHTLSPTSMRVTWSGSGLDAIYTVKYTSSSDGMLLRYVNSSETSVVVENLKPATEYEFAVRVAVPSLSAWSMAVRNRTLPAPPSSSPRDLTILPAVSGDPQSATVNWQPPKYANGEIEEYLLFYTDRSTARDEEWTQVSVPGERLSHAINSLLPKSKYFFKIQAKNVKGFGPMSSVQVYAPSGAPVSQSTRVRNASASPSWWPSQWNPLHVAVAAALVLLLILVVVLLTVCCLRGGKRRSPGYVPGKKSSAQHNGDLWINHPGGNHLRGDMISEGASMTDMKHLHGPMHADSPPPRYQAALLGRTDDVGYGVVCTRRTPIRASLAPSSVCEDDSSSRPLVGRAKPIIVVPGSQYSDQDSSGTLSRSYHHSSSSLEARQRTPQVVYTGGVRNPQMKIDLGESPYGSSSGLGPGTPPPPNMLPPHPPVVSADGYRTLRGPQPGLRSFTQLGGQSASPRGGPRQVPIARAAPQPRVNVANIYSPYPSCSALSVEEEKNRMDERGESLGDQLPLEPSLSTEQLHAQVENLDNMINDLQALQYEFGVQSS